MKKTMKSQKKSKPAKVKKSFPLAPTQTVGREVWDKDLWQDMNSFDIKELK